jgi:hypothetical protein
VEGFELCRQTRDFGVRQLEPHTERRMSLTVTKRKPFDSLAERPFLENGESSRTRTCDPRLKKPLLCQLSYAPTQYRLCAIPIKKMIARDCGRRQPWNACLHMAVRTLRACWVPPVML